MSSVQNVLEALAAEYMAQDGTDEVFRQEAPILQEALEAVEQELRGWYDFVDVLGRGGAGIVLKVRDLKLELERALKIPRPREEEIRDTVKMEMGHLVRLRHQNIIAVHTLGEVAVRDASYPYFVMDFIPSAKDLRKRLSDLLQGASTTRTLADVTGWLGRQALAVAQALAYLHREGIVHFDVKPANILIDTRDTSILSDLGFAKTRSDSRKKVPVGFTLFYAHPDLSEHYLKGSSLNRILKPVAPKDFRFEWDLFALGKTLLECLALVDRVFPESVGYDYTFLYLHLCACRMLDARNVSDDEFRYRRDRQKDMDPQSYLENWMSLGRHEFEELRYSTADELVDDLEKLFNPRHAIRRLPELDASYPHRVQTSMSRPAPFSPRVKKLVEHPVFARLARVPQLGLVGNVFPTATHTRFQHALGAFSNCCVYVQSLLADSFSPLFRQIVTERDLSAVLLASLLHDLGQFPLAHELEEVDDAFNHDAFSLRLLESKATDADGHTIADIISNLEWGWSSSVEAVKSILQGRKTVPGLIGGPPLRTRLLASLVDGPLDVDKVDYLVRDSHTCFLPYGLLLDYDRLVRNLTVVITHRGFEADLSLGVYDRGQSAAEALIFARYLLYQSIYWHHTYRSIRAMLAETVRRALTLEKTGTGGARKGRKRSSLREELFGRVERGADLDDILDLLEGRSDDSGARMVQLIRERRFYKRLLTLHDERPLEEGRESQLDAFRNACSRPAFRGRLRKKVAAHFATVTAGRSTSDLSALSPERVNAAAKALEDDIVLLVDAPDPQFGSRQPLRIIPEPKRLERNYLSRVETGERVSEVWTQVHHRLMRFAAKGRVFCHPDIRDTVVAAIGPEELRGYVQECVGHR